MVAIAAIVPMAMIHSMAAKVCLMVHVFGLSVILQILLLTDIDECDGDTLNACSPNATCANTNGSYTCTCDTGYTGDGFSCSGMYQCVIVANLSRGKNGTITDTFWDNNRNIYMHAFTGTIVI